MMIMTNTNGNTERNTNGTKERNTNENTNAQEDKISQSRNKYKWK